MYTFCPECATIFAVTGDHLNKAGGVVRCGACHHAYRALDYLYEDLAAAREAVDERQVPGAVAPDDSRDDSAASHMAGADEAAEEADVSDAVMNTGSLHTLSLPELSAAWTGRSVSLRDISGVAAVGVLLLLLVVQWLYFNRSELAVDVAWRPTLERLCAVTGCELPMRVDVSRIELLDRDVRKHPAAEDALLVNATLINHAEFTQPYPVFSVGFANLSGSMVAVRRFSPAEYLSEVVNIEGGMATDTPVQVMLEIQDPGEDAVSFQFNFL